MSVATKDIGITDDKITALGEMPTDFVPDKTIDAKEMLAIPGLINAHTHASMTLLRSYADDMALDPWLSEKIWPIEDAMTPEDLYWGAALAAVEMIKSGTTAFADMYGPYMREVAKATIESGLRGILARGIVAVAPGCYEKLADSVDFYKEYHGADNGRITVMLSPHSLYTCPPDFIKKLAAGAAKIGAEVHIHMAETVLETENCIKEYGKRPFPHVESTGLFENGTLAAHCVYLDDKDFAIIKKHSIRVVHNPGSNMKLASGVAPIPRMLKENICVGLGTDGASSNNNMDMLEEVRLSALLHKVHELDPLAVSAKEALRMGTQGGAEAVGLTNVGKIEVGYKADIVLISRRNPTWYPRHNPLSQLVYSGNSADVDTVMVDGRILMAGRKLTTLDEEKIYAEADKCVQRLFN